MWGRGVKAKLIWTVFLLHYHQNWIAPIDEVALTILNKPRLLATLGIGKSHHQYYFMPIFSLD